MGRRKKIEDRELLAAAREVFTERGLVGSSKEIARKAGVSEAALFQRYGTRDKLFFAAMMPRVAFAFSPAVAAMRTMFPSCFWLVAAWKAATLAVSSVKNVAGIPASVNSSWSSVAAAMMACALAMSAG